MNSPKQLLHKDKDALERVAEYVANPLFERVLHTAFAEFVYNLSDQQQPAAADLKRQGAKAFMETAIGLGKFSQTPKKADPLQLGPMPGDPGYDEWAKTISSKKN